MLNFNQIKDNLNDLKDNIAQITSNPIQIILVTKTFPAKVYQICQALGISHVGENKVQELKNKMNLTEEGIRTVLYTHFIGHLQTNKIKDLYGIVSSLDSLTSEKQLNQINSVWSGRSGQTSAKPLPVLLQINSTNEENKSGIPIAKQEMIFEMAEKCLQSDFVKLEGLMTIGPTPDLRDNFDFHQKSYMQKAQMAFQKTKKMKELLEKKFEFTLPRLSMGMSHDYQLAIQEGATEIRVGSLILGERQQHL